MPSLVPFSNSAVQGCSPFQAPLCLSWVHAYLWVNQQDYHNFDTLSIQGAPWRLDFGICGLHVHFAILCLEKAREKANMLHVEAGVSNLRMCCLTSGQAKTKELEKSFQWKLKLWRCALWQDWWSQDEEKISWKNFYIKGWKSCVCVYGWTLLNKAIFWASSCKS